MQEYEYLDCSNYQVIKTMIAKEGLRNFKFHKKIQNDTSQGSVGILKCMAELENNLFSEKLSARDFLVNYSSTPITDKYIVYKIAIETPLLSFHEHAISKSLFKISNFVPNFMRPYDLIKNMRADPRQQNPFISYVANDKNNVLKMRPKTFSDLALFEYIHSNITLGDLLNNKKKEISKYNAINSLLNQLMISILIAQQKLSFVHNDLHFDNVLVCKCFKKTFALYVFEISDSVCFALLPTFGYYPIIIDYGFSFCKDIIGGPLLTGIHHNNKGYINHQYDELTDFKTMLVRLASTEYNFDKSNRSAEFKKIIEKELLQKLPIDKQTGWDNVNEISIGKQLVRRVRLFLNDYFTKTKSESFFKKYDYELVDIVGSLIILPLSYKSYDNLEESLNNFLQEWEKIEKWISSSHLKIFVFKHIIETVRKDLLSTDEQSIINFQKSIHKVMNNIGNNIVLGTMNYNLFYKSILNLSDCFEGLMYQFNQKFTKRKALEYSRLNFNTSLQMYQLVEPFISVDYQIQYGDYFVVFDAINETTASFVIDNVELATLLNNMDRSDRAQYLFESINTAK